MITEQLKEESGLNLYNRYLEEIGVPERLGIREDPDSEGLYELYIVKDNQRAPLYNEIDETELGDDVMEAYYEISRTRYVVTYVGLSDSESDADGYCNAWLYATRCAADKKVQQLIAEEKIAHDDAVVEKDESEWTISWAGGSEKVIIRIHTKRIAYV